MSSTMINVIVLLNLLSVIFYAWMSYRCRQQLKEISEIRDGYDILYGKIVNKYWHSFTAEQKLMYKRYLPRDEA